MIEESFWAGGTAPSHFQKDTKARPVVEDEMAGQRTFVEGT